MNYMYFAGQRSYKYKNIDDYVLECSHNVNHEPYWSLYENGLIDRDLQKVMQREFKLTPETIIYKKYEGTFEPYLKYRGTFIRIGIPQTLWDLDYELFSWIDVHKNQKTCNYEGSTEIMMDGQVLFKRDTPKYVIFCKVPGKKSKVNTKRYLSILASFGSPGYTIGKLNRYFAE